MAPLLRRNLSSNGISGKLPNNWGWANVFTQLEVLTLDANALSGSIPGSYGTAGAFKSLLVMNLDHNKLSGALLVPEFPAEAASHGKSMLDLKPDNSKDDCHA